MLIDVVLSYAVLVYCPSAGDESTPLPDTTDVVLEDDWPMARSYRLEDFLWSGSGDGATEVLSSPWATTTVFRTTTVMATVFTTPLYEGSGEGKPQPTPVWPKPTGVINPTPTLRPPLSTALFPFPSYPDNNDTASAGTPDQRFWLLTVLIANNSLLGDTGGLEARLAHIYKIAFSRHQEHHLGIGNSTAPKQPSRYRRAQQTLSVHVHNMTARGDREIELLYSVRVAGQLIPALTAADDMRLVSTAEVEFELGYQVLTKAEPYLKNNLPLNGGVRMARGRDTWLMVGAAVSAVCLLLLLVALVALALGKRKRRPVATNRQQVFEREQEAGVANLGYEEEGVGVKNKASSHRSSSFQQASVSFQDDPHRLSSASSASSSQASLVRRRPTQGQTARRAGKRGARRRTKGQDEDEDITEKPQPKPRRRQNLHGSSKQFKGDLEVEQQQDALDGSNDELTEPPSAGDITRVGPAVSPNSLLSMPSVKSFPRGANIPEPLARVLEPVGVDTKGLVIQPQRLVAKPVKLSRHGSVEGEDPGVVGPLVWDLHCHHLLYQKQANKNIGAADCRDEDVDEVEDMDEVDVRRSPGVAASNVGRMRRRFNELLDDAFSLFGSRSVSPDESSSPPLNGAATHRVHSAIVRPVGEPFNFDLTPRPRTSGCRPATAAARPRGAWVTKEPSIASAISGTLARPLSAGPFHRPQLTLSGEPIIERDLVLEDSRLAPSDPAVPLIAAIKEELRKFQDAQLPPTLPGAATPKI